MSPSTPSIVFPLEGTWLVLNPPGHPRHMDGPDFAEANVLPFRVRSYDRWIEGHWVPMRDQPLPLRKGRIRAEAAVPGG